MILLNKFIINSYLYLAEIDGVLILDDERDIDCEHASFLIRPNDMNSILYAGGIKENTFRLSSINEKVILTIGYCFGQTYNKLFKPNEIEIFYDARENKFILSCNDLNNEYMNYYAINLDNEELFNKKIKKLIAIFQIECKN